MGSLHVREWLKMSRKHFYVLAVDINFIFYSFYYWTGLQTDVICDELSSGVLVVMSCGVMSCGVVLVMNWSDELEWWAELWSCSCEGSPAWFTRGISPPHVSTAVIILPGDHLSPSNTNCPGHYTVGNTGGPGGSLHYLKSKWIFRFFTSMTFN